MELNEEQKFERVQPIPNSEYTWEMFITDRYNHIMSNKNAIKITGIDYYVNGEFSSRMDFVEEYFKLYNDDRMTYE